jgi:Protein of unknown function (DUF3618)
MTENDPIGGPYRPTAGEVGLHRQEPGTATPESAGPSLNVPQVHAPPKPYVKPVVSHGKGDPLAGLSEPPVRASQEAPPDRTGQEAPPERKSKQTARSEEDRLRDDIFHTREELGRTVEALAQKVDVKARAQQKVAETKVVAREKAAEVAGRLREAASKATTSPTGTTGEGVPGALKGVAGQITTQARRRPEVLLIVAGALTMGAGWLGRPERRSRPGATTRT